jgi:hypothetical protein
MDSIQRDRISKRSKAPRLKAWIWRGDNGYWLAAAGQVFGKYQLRGYARGAARRRFRNHVIEFIDGPPPVAAPASRGSGPCLLCHRVVES